MERCNFVTARKTSAGCRRSEGALFTRCKPDLMLTPLPESISQPYCGDYRLLIEPAIFCEPERILVSVNITTSAFSHRLPMGILQSPTSRYRICLGYESGLRHFGKKMVPNPARLYRPLLSPHMLIRKVDPVETEKTRSDLTAEKYSAGLILHRLCIAASADVARLWILVCRGPDLA